MEQVDEPRRGGWPGAARDNFEVAFSVGADTLEVIQHQMLRNQNIADGLFLLIDAKRDAYHDDGRG